MNASVHHKPQKDKKMKTIYLEESGKFRVFEYSSLGELSNEFEKRNITIGNDTWIGDYVEIGNGTWIGYGVGIGDYVEIGNHVWISDHVRIGSCAEIGNGVNLEKSLFIKGSEHPVTYVGEGKMSIGCYTKKIEWFENNYETLGKNYKYSDNHIKEYAGHIKSMKKFYETISNTN